MHDQKDYDEDGLTRHMEREAGALSGLSVDDIETIQGMVEFCIRNGYCMGMHEGVDEDFEPRPQTKRLAAFSEIDVTKYTRATPSKKPENGMSDTQALEALRTLGDSSNLDDIERNKLEQIILTAISPPENAGDTQALDNFNVYVDRFVPDNLNRTLLKGMYKAALSAETVDVLRDLTDQAPNVKKEEKT